MKYVLPLVLITGLILSSCTTPSSSAPNPKITNPFSVGQTPLLQPTTEPVHLEDGLGHNIDLPGPAQRIVSIAPSNTEILYAVGAGDQVVGVEMFSDYPEQAKSLPNVGGGYGQLDTEKIVSLKPDLLLAAELTPKEQVKSLEDLGLTVFMLKNPTTFDGLYENLIMVGKLTGHEEQAQTLVDSLKKRVSTVEEKVAKTTARPLVFYELDGQDPNNPWTSGSGTFISMMLDMAGAKNLGDEMSDSWGQMSIEELINKDPDYILLGDYTWGGVTIDDVKGRQGWDGLGAVKNDKVLPFDDNLVSRPGPRLVDGLEQLAKLLHPEVFK